jgi:osmotically inducible lipoprotein OsmB
VNKYTHVTVKKWIIRTLAVVTVVSVVGCAGLTRRDENTILGAGIGGVAGSVLTGGDALGTVGGAAVGGLIGNQVNKR